MQHDDGRCLVKKVILDLSFTKKNPPKKIVKKKRKILTILGSFVNTSPADATYVNWCHEIQ